MAASLMSMPCISHHVTLSVKHGVMFRTSHRDGLDQACPIAVVSGSFPAAGRSLDDVLPVGRLAFLPLHVAGEV